MELESKVNNDPQKEEGVSPLISISIATAYVKTNMAELSIDVAFLSPTHQLPVTRIPSL